MAILAKLVSVICVSSIDPILSLHMMDLGWSEDDSGFGLAIYATAWAIGAPLVGVLCQRIRRRVVIFLAFNWLTLALLLVGPSAILGLPLRSEIVLVGLVFLGFGVAGCFVPLVPEIFSAVADGKDQADSSQRG